MRGYLAAGFLRLCALFPLPVLHAVAVPLGWALTWLPNRARRIAQINLEFCLPEYSVQERQRLLRANLIETCKSMLELGPIWLWSPQRVQGLVRRMEGYTAWQTAIAQGKGVIAMVPHMGCWEIVPVYLSIDQRTTFMYRPSKMAAINSLMYAARSRNQANPVPTDRSGIKALLAALKAGEPIGVLPDQDPLRESGEFVPLFGHPVNTVVLLSRLAQKSKAPVFSVIPRRLPRGRGFELIFQAEPDISHPDQSLHAMNLALERIIRNCPEQYLWAYKRFKTRPPEYPKLYS